MSLRLLQSLRAAGGRFASAPFFAVWHRRGPRPLAATRVGLAALGAVQIDAARENDFPWTPYFGKTVALLAAERLTAAGSLCFLDCDILVTREPDELALGPGEDFAACPSHGKHLASTGPGDPEEVYWSRACRSLGYGVESLPWTVTTRTRERVRLHFNAGVLVYRRASGFAAAWHKNFRGLLQSRIAHPLWGVHHVDEVSLAVTVAQLGLAWRPLPLSHNHSFPSWVPGPYDPAAWEGAALLHYHTAMLGANWGRFLESLAVAFPRAHDLVAGSGPVDRGGRPFAQAVRTYFRAARSLKRRRFVRGCEVVALPSVSPRRYTWG